MIPLIRKLLWDIRWPLLVSVLLLMTFEILWVKIAQRTTTHMAPFFSTLAARAGVLQKEIEAQIFSGPGKIVQTLAGGENVRFERAMDVLSIGYLHPLIQIMLCIWAIGRASLAIAGELDRGTLELLLAQPIPRSHVIGAHLAVDCIAIPIIALALGLGTTLGFALTGPFTVSAADLQAVNKLPFAIRLDPALLEVRIAAFFPALINVAALVFAVSGVTMAISAAGRFRNRVIGYAVLTFLLMFLVNVLGQLWDVMAWMRPLTVFYYYQPQQIILSDNWTVDPSLIWNYGPGSVNVVVILGLTGLLGYLIAWSTFTRRDLPAPL